MAEYVRAPEAARRLGVSRVALYHKVRRNLVPAYRIGHILYFDMKEIEERIRRNKV